MNDNNITETCKCIIMRELSVLHNGTSTPQLEDAAIRKLAVVAEVLRAVKA